VATPILRCLLLFVACSLLPGCWYARIRNPVPENQLDSARIPNMPLIRAWGDGDDPNLQKMLEQSTIQEIQFRRSQHLTGPLPPAYALAISGGGSNGAFGAGLLTGWTQAGTRPQFKVVTGVSTGALIAPFAFIGPTHDADLAIYAHVSDQDIYFLNPLFKLLSADGAANPQPLKDLIAKLVTSQLLNEIAIEHAKGRRLFVATTNLDAQRSVVWDMGAIASSGNTEALTLFRNVLLASASVPGVFPPVYFDVEANGKKYDEMHVDGCTTAQVFFNVASSGPRAILPQYPESTPDRELHLFLLRNAQTLPEYKAVDAGMVPIVQRAISTLTKANGNGDIVRIYAIARRESIHFHLADMPAALVDDSKTAFDPAYMKHLFDAGVNAGKSNTIWHESPSWFRLDRPIPPSLPASATAPATRATTSPATAPATQFH
jgi:hypothetical protein